MSVHSQTVPMRTFWLFFLVLLFLHQDFWNWSDESLVGLGYAHWIILSCFIFTRMFGLGGLGSHSCMADRMGKIC